MSEFMNGDERYLEFIDPFASKKEAPKRIKITPDNMKDVKDSVGKILAVLAAVEDPTIYEDENFDEKLASVEYAPILTEEQKERERNFINLLDTIVNTSNIKLEDFDITRVRENLYAFLTIPEGLMENFCKKSYSATHLEELKQWFREEGGPDISGRISPLLSVETIQAALDEAEEAFGSVKEQVDQLNEEVTPEDVSKFLQSATAPSKEEEPKVETSDFVNPVTSAKKADAVQVAMDTAKNASIFGGQSMPLKEEEPVQKSEEIITDEMINTPVAYITPTIGVTTKNEDILEAENASLEEEGQAQRKATLDLENATEKETAQAATAMDVATDEDPLRLAVPEDWKENPEIQKMLEEDSELKELLEANDAIKETLTKQDKTLEDLKEQEQELANRRYELLEEHTKYQKEVAQTEEALNRAKEERNQVVLAGKGKIRELLSQEQRQYQQEQRAKNEEIERANSRITDAEQKNNTTQQEIDTYKKEIENNSREVQKVNEGTEGLKAYFDTLVGNIGRKTVLAGTKAADEMKIPTSQTETGKRYK